MTANNEEDSDSYVSMEQAYAVEEIRSYKMSNGVEYFLVKWLGYPEAQNTWEPYENLINVKKMVEDFKEKFKKAKTFTPKPKGQQPASDSKPRGRPPSDQTKKTVKKSVEKKKVRQNTDSSNVKKGKPRKDPTESSESVAEESESELPPRIIERRQTIDGSTQIPENKISRVNHAFPKDGQIFYEVYVKNNDRDISMIMSSTEVLVQGPQALAQFFQRSLIDDEL